MTNVIGDIYDALKTLIEDNILGYLDALSDTADDDVDLKNFVNIHREYVDMYNLPAYPSLTFGYGEISFDDEHPTTHERWILPISLYAVVSGAQSTITQKLCESYSFALCALLWGEEYSSGTLYVTSFGVSPAMSRPNQIIQVGYVDLNIEVQVLRDQI